VQVNCTALNTAVQLVQVYYLERGAEIRICRTCTICTTCTALTAAPDGAGPSGAFRPSPRDASAEF
jgi:hypothetical protein